MSVVTEDGLKKMPLEEALSLADEAGMDLVLVSNNKENPVCKIVDYDKMMYEQKKKAHQAAKKPMQTKEIRMSNHIALNDIKIKVDAIARILLEGNRVKVSVVFKGREIRLINTDILKEIVAQLQREDSKVHFIKTPKYIIDGNRATMVIDPT